MKFQGVFLVAGVPLDGFDQVWNEVVAPLELDVDLRPGVLRFYFFVDQAVVDANG
jgi:hypothetical protein